RSHYRNRCGCGSGVGNRSSFGRRQSDQPLSLVKNSTKGGFFAAFFIMIAWLARIAEDFNHLVNRLC
ncbi:MAG: hypothetical protein WA793_13205, partial [Sphingorhabdus sp.]|uniref:hypothetical protein n=1 Tax=Sphingorhabdus sp. TaxID=1902408 RepID=UPI003C9085B5